MNNLILLNKGNGDYVIDGDDRVPALTSLILQVGVAITSAMTFVGTLGNLLTDAKDNIVNAVNENFNKIANIISGDIKVGNSDKLNGDIAGYGAVPYTIVKRNSLGKINSINLPSNFRGDLPLPNGEVYTHWEFDKLQDGSYFMYDTFALDIPTSLSYAFQNAECLIEKNTISYDGNLVTILKLLEFISGTTLWCDFTSALEETDETTMNSGDWYGTSCIYSERAVAAYNYLGGGQIDTVLQGKAPHTLPSYLTIPTPTKGRMAFNITTNKPVWYNGTHWIYADGTTV